MVKACSMDGIDQKFIKKNSSTEKASEYALGYSCRT